MTQLQQLTYAALPGLAPKPTHGDVPESVDLPCPDLTASLPLMAALSLRASTREFAAMPLPLERLGALLWAADGVNRSVTGGRTAPSPCGLQEVDVYAALPNGVYRYDPATHRLILKHAIDARNMTGYQDFVGTAALDLIYVVRTSKLLTIPTSQRDIFSAVTAGAISQNVSLFCASAGLATVVRGWINHRLLGDALSLNEDELPILAQTVGFRVDDVAGHAHTKS